MQLQGTRQGGFTLAEIAVVAVIFGALSLGILGMSTVIDHVTARTLNQEMREVGRIFHAYVERHGRLPGLAAGAPPGTSRIEGNWTGEGLSGAGEDSGNFWRDVRGAGLIRGKLEHGHQKNAVNGHLGVSANGKHPNRPAGIKSIHVVCTGLVHGEIARIMDSSIDDGDATSGKVWAAEESEGAPVLEPAAPSTYEIGKTYTVCTVL